MKCIIPWIIIASLAASAFGRYLQPQPVGNISRVEYDVKLNPGTGADTPSTPGMPLSPDSPLAESASDDLWAKHVRKGNDLICGLCATDLGAGLQIGDTRTPPSAASRWAGDVVERTDWYWFEGMYEPFECEMDGFWGMGNMFRALGISLLSKAEGGDVQCFQLQHRNDQAKNPDGTPKDVRFQTYEIEGREYFATDARHFFAINLRAGVLIGIDLKGPKAAAQYLWGWTPVPDQLPKLRNLSDLYWGYWLWHNYMAGTSVSNLRAYIVYGIQNTETEEIVARAIRSRGKEELEPWPGQYFPVDSVEGRALLGSPIGATIGHLLLQHKAELGNKYVIGVNIVRNDKHQDGDIDIPDLIFHIMDVSPERLAPDPPNTDPSQSQPQPPAVLQAVGRSIVEALPGDRPFLNSSTVKKHVLGEKNVLRVHTIKVY